MNFNLFKGQPLEMQYLVFKGSAKNGQMKPPVGGFRAAAQLQGCNFKRCFLLN